MFIIQTAQWKNYSVEFSVSQPVVIVAGQFTEITWILHISFDLTFVVYNILSL